MKVNWGMQVLFGCATHPFGLTYLFVYIPNKYLYLGCINIRNPSDVVMEYLELNQYDSALRAFQ